MGMQQPEGDQSYLFVLLPVRCVVCDLAACGGAAENQQTHHHMAVIISPTTTGVVHFMNGFDFPTRL